MDEKKFQSLIDEMNAAYELIKKPYHKLCKEKLTDDQTLVFGDVMLEISEFFAE